MPTPSSPKQRPTGPIKTGIDGLDALLRGGFRPVSSVLIQGAPGTGKTILGLQCAWNSATLFDEPAIFVTFDPFVEDLYRDARAFGWDFHDLEQRRKAKILPLDPDALHSSFPERQSEALNQITDAASAFQARRIVVDGVRHFRQFQPTGREQRHVLCRFIAGLKALNLTSFLTYELTDLLPDAVCEEEFVCDLVVRLYFRRRARFGGRDRQIEVLKARGQDFLEGTHPFWFTPQGIRVLALEETPRLLRLLRDLNAAVESAAPQGSEQTASLRATVRALSEDMAECLGMAPADLGLPPSAADKQDTP
jgi:circadian clock protein KaiC